MKKRARLNNIALTSLEYAVFISAVAAALSAMIWMVSHKLQATHKESADAFGEGRQFGSRSGGGGGPVFEFPSLPGGSSGGGGTPPPGTPDCDAAYLAQLAQDAKEKQDRAKQLTDLATQAREEANQAGEDWGNARGAYERKNQEAEQARTAANNKREECDECESDCTDICDEATRLEEVAANLEAEANRLLGIAEEKERIYHQKDEDATLLEQSADRARLEAAQAAEALQKANEKCYSGGGGGGGGGCFLRGTKVTLADGSLKPIEEITTHDSVLSYNGKSAEPAKVAKVFIHAKERRYLVIVTDDGRQIKVTPSHPVFTGKDYKDAGTLKKGESLFVLAQGKLQATTIKSITVKNETVKVYNIEVAKTHNYFAEGILCHNKPPIPQAQ